MFNLQIEHLERIEHIERPERNKKLARISPGEVSIQIRFPRKGI
jgi:hypothetical protein